MIRYRNYLIALAFFIITAFPASAGSSGDVTGAILTDVQRVGGFIACDNIQEIQLTIQWFEGKNHEAVTSAIGGDAVSICRTLAGVSLPVWVNIRGNIVNRNGHTVFSPESVSVLSPAL